MLIDSAAAFAQRQRGTAPGTLPRQEASVPVLPVLPVLPAVGGLLPWGGLRRGTTVEVVTGQRAPAHPSRSPAGRGESPAGSSESPAGRGEQGAVAAMSLLLALLAGPSRSGSWCALVGVPDLGLLAAQEAGVELSRLALVPAPGRDWAKAAAALVDGCDVVVVRPPANPLADGRRLVARVRHRGAVLVSVGGWPGAEVRLTATAEGWEGTGDDGHGYLTARRVTVRAEGRGAAARPREAELWLPAPRSEGSSVVEPVWTPVHHRVEQQVV